MNIESTVRSVIRLPYEFQGRGDVSVYALLQRAGYFEVHEQVTEGVIHDALRGCPEIVDLWVEFSESKRSNAGWYLLPAGGKDGCRVGHYLRQDPVNYTDELAACAAYIKREIEDIRTDGRSC